MNDGPKRYNRVEVATQMPGVDFITKSPNGPFIDTGYRINFGEWKSGSHVYLSIDTIREMAEELGLFGEAKQESVLAQEVAWYNRGYGDAVKENIGGELRDIVDRLGNVSDIIAGLDRLVVGQEPAAAERGEPEVLDGDESDARRVGRTAHGAAQGAHNPFRQGDSALGVERPDDIPADSVDESSWRI